MNALSENARGAIFMMFSMAGFVFNDALMKLASSELPLFQAIFIRGIFASIFMAALAYYLGALNPPSGWWKTTTHPTVIVRTICEMGATFFFLNALFNMPIANVTAVLQLLPLTVTLGAALFFGEAVGWRRYGAIIVGFLGVLLIVKPGTNGFNIFAWSALAATLLVTGRDLATRRLPRDTPSLFISFITAVVITLMGAVGSMTTSWSVVSMSSLLQLGCAATFVLGGYIFSVLAMRNGEVSFISPFRYSILIWALLLGYFIFDELPDGWAAMGAVIVVSSGLFTFYRERQAARRVEIPKV